MKTPLLVSRRRAAVQACRTTVALLLLACTTGYAAVGGQDGAGKPQADPATAPPLQPFAKPISIQDGRLTGEGAAALLAEARAARFILIGEEHGLQAPPRIAAAITREVAVDGRYRALAEIGPVSGEVVSGLARSDDAAWESLFRKAPFSIPFFWLREDVEWLRAFPNPADDLVWGVDQELMLSPMLHLENWASTGDENLRKPAAALLAKEKAAYDQVVRERRPNDSLLLTGDGIGLRALAPHLDAAGLRTLEALERSRQIYALYAAGRGHDNNAERARYMRGLIRDHLRADPDARLIGKFGANHVQRGHSVLGINDIGNQLAEYADFNGESSLHLLVLPASGAKNAVLPFTGSSAGAVPVNCGTLGPFKPLCDAAGPVTGWSLYDLRPLRARRSELARFDPGLPALVLGFDFLVLVPDDAPATLWQANLEAAD